MCSITDWLTAAGTIATAGAAIYVAATWRQNLRKATQHEIAAKVLEEASLFKYQFYEARSSMYWAAEFPDWYNSMKDEDRSNDQNAKAWTHVFTSRWKIVGPQMAVLARLRARARILLGEEVAKSIEVLARTALQLQNYMGYKIDQYREGSEIVAQWSDQKFVALVNASVQADTEPEDAFSKEFEEKLLRLEKLVEPFL